MYIARGLSLFGRLGLYKGRTTVGTNTLGTAEVDIFSVGALIRF